MISVITVNTVRQQSQRKDSVLFLLYCVFEYSIKKIRNISKKYFSNDCSDHSEHSVPTITKTGFSSIFACIVYLSIYPKYAILVKNILIIIIHFPYMNSMINDHSYRVVAKISSCQGKYNK